MTLSVLERTKNNPPGQTGFVPGMEDSRPPLVFNVVNEDDENKKAVPIKIEMINDGQNYRVIATIYGAIYDIRFYHELIGYLESAQKGDQIVLLLASPGGSVSIGSMIGSCIENSEATVIGIAYGATASISAFMWCCCDEQEVFDGSNFLFHMSTHGDQGVSTSVKERADHVIRYMKEYILDIALRKGFITEDEFDMATTTGKDLVIDFKEMARRIVESRGRRGVE